MMIMTLTVEKINAFSVETPCERIPGFLIQFSPFLFICFRIWSGRMASSTIVLLLPQRIDETDHEREGMEETMGVILFRSENRMANMFAPLPNALMKKQQRVILLGHQNNFPSLIFISSDLHFLCQGIVDSPQLMDSAGFDGF
jgi:hypothetical protein